MSISFPGESPGYRIARDRLLQQEIELRRATEALAEARRALPPGGIVGQDYIFQQASDPTEVRLSQLFRPGMDTLVVYNFMFSPDDARPCLGCTSLLDTLDGAAKYIMVRVNFVVVAKAPLPRILAYAQERGWRSLRLLSSNGNTYKQDYFGETEEGDQLPIVNVFRRDGETIRHFWSSELFFAPNDPGQDPRHNDPIDPLWNLFDLTPDGRGTDWHPAQSLS